MTSEVEAAPPPAVQEQKKGPIQRIFGALFSPDETFRDIASRPDILVPLAVLVVISILSTIVITPRIDFATSMREQIENSPRGHTLAAEDLDRMVRFSTAFAKALAYFSPLIIIAGWAIIAGVLLIAFRLFGGEGNYKQAFSVTLYAWLPVVVKGIIGTIVALSKGTLTLEQLSVLVRSNAAFLVDMKAQPIAFSLLSSLDLFTIWSVVLFVIGFAYVSRMSKARSATIVVSLWAFVLLVKLGFAAIGAARMKAAS